MKVVGYGDRLSAAPGERIAFMVSCTEPSYETALVQPAHVESLRRELESPVNGSHPGRVQTLPLGSSVVIDRPVPRPGRLATSLWAFATAPTGREQTLYAWSDGDGLFLTPDGFLQLRAGGAAVALAAPLPAREWTEIHTEIADGAARLSQRPRRWGRAATARGPLTHSGAAAAFVIGAQFDGKLEAVTVDGVAAWDFTIGIPTLRVTDTGPARLDGRVVNMPMRGVTGHRWTGRCGVWSDVPAEYGAIHFHHDDLSDARWDVDFTLDVPEDLPSGMYAVRLRAGDEESYVSFYVRGPGSARIAFLAPTFSHLAYSCETSGAETSPSIPEEERQRKIAALSAADHYSADHGLLSLYDLHHDGSGTCFVSRLRPIPNMQPYYISPPIDAAHQLGADLHVIDWLRLLGEPFEVLTDEDLHHGGPDALAPYRVVLSGTHPEYWSGRMLDAVESFLVDGNRFMYLGGNGMYWVTDPHPDAPEVLEVRRTQAGTRAWQSAPGECVQQSTGEPSGLWRFRGREPHKVFGVGMAAHGYDYATGYTREPASLDPRYAWIFDGVGADEVIGDFGAIMGGAAGFEIDSLDAAQGSPPGTVLLATAPATGFTDSYQGVVENVLMESSTSGASVNRAVRADMTYLRYPSGGAVFCTGSVTWAGSLTHEGGANNVATITGNVVRRFASDDELADTAGDR